MYPSGVQKPNPGGEDQHHAKPSITLSAESLIMSPPCTSDTLTLVIYHTHFPRHTQGGEKEVLCWRDTTGHFGGRERETDNAQDDRDDTE